VFGYTEVIQKRGCGKLLGGTAFPRGERGNPTSGSNLEWYARSLLGHLGVRPDRTVVI
jgi:hypothetical protein